MTFLMGHHRFSSDGAEMNNRAVFTDEVALAIMKNTVINIRRLVVDIDDLTERSNLMRGKNTCPESIVKGFKLIC